MKLKKEHIALIGVLLLVFGIEMVVVQSVVLNRVVSQFVVERLYPNQQYAFMVKDSTGTLTVRPIRVPVPDTIGHCVATSGLVLLLSCFITIKPD